MTDARYRLVVLGSGRVGKTSLVRRFLYNDFPARYKETVEDLHARDFRVHGATLPLDIVDTNFNYPDMRRLAVAGANAILIVFAIDNVASFKDMSELWDEICQRRTDVKSIPTVVVANKTDLGQKKINAETAQAWLNGLAAQTDVRYLEASARTGENVAEVFRALLRLSGFPQSMKQTPLALAAAAPTGSLSLLPRASIRRNRSMRGRPDSASEDDARAAAVPKSPLAARTSLDPPDGRDPAPMARHGSLIRRTKQLSLRGRRADPEDSAADDSDCKIS